ncbi:transglutaminase-like cysteine peptidase [Agrobacterium tumefaciens]|uniref:transglutaminase-like cysteine peptidase n=1 Tax=Agrobacterium tumefaciens TaxID=358 RepID=UPI0021D3303B|nr:transglutaminase-like cysteine peptidase [Agrobacterium tumefaciens]UXS05109.1 transglutaminase-like cysteine peptidase [Agrobacterium tumefaciens]
MMSFSSLVQSKSARALLALSVLGIPVTAIAAGPGSLTRNINRGSAFVMERGATLAPFAHVKFCISNPDQCERKNGPRLVEFAGSVKAKIMEINRNVNASISPVLDAPGKEVWEIDSAQGACNDYAVTKRKRLIDSGIPSSAVRLAVAKTGAGEGHAVVVVRTNEGDMVLDNRTNSIVRWDRTDLRWIKIQASDDANRWSLM